VDDAWATVDALAADAEHGAAEIAQRAARTLPQIPRQELPDAIETLLRGHPQMGPLWRLASDVLSSPDAASGAQVFLARLTGDAQAISVLARTVPDVILTISYSSTVKEAIRTRRPRQVICMRSDPGGEGLKMLGSISGYTDASVIPDDEALTKVPAKAVVVGADAITPTSVLNKVKTRRLAEAARNANVPTFAVAGETKFVPDELPVGEPFEAAGLELFSGVATPTGVITPPHAMSLAASVEMHPALRKLVGRITDEPAEDSFS
jgi:translation initiation factor 2B subunit (eIF-2B alpha/beta/delta family)